MQQPGYILFEPGLLKGREAIKKGSSQLVYLNHSHHFLSCSSFLKVSLNLLQNSTILRLLSRFRSFKMTRQIFLIRSIISFSKTIGACGFPVLQTHKSEQSSKWKRKRPQRFHTSDQKKLRPSSYRPYYPAYRTRPSPGWTCSCRAFQRSDNK